MTSAYLLTDDSKNEGINIGKIAQSKPMISVVVLNYNGRDVLERCLDSVLKNNYEDFEVIVVDNASADGSQEIAKRFAVRDPRVRLVQNSRNWGFVVGNNIGAKAARGKYIALFNNDTEVSQNTLREAVKYMEADQQIGLLEGKILLHGKWVTYPGKRINPIVGGSHRDAFLEEDKGQFDYVHEIFSPGGVAPIVRKSLIDEIGLFDPVIWWSNDVEDLSWRIHLRGYKVLFVPSIVINHLARLGAAWYPREMLMRLSFHATKNGLYVVLKNCSLRNLMKYVPVIIVMRMAEAVYLFLGNKPDLFIIKMRAHFWIIKNLRHIWAQRVRVQRYIRRMPDKYVFRLTSRPDFATVFMMYNNLLRVIKFRKGC